MHFDIHIPCPVCKTSIPADRAQLLSGVQFACPGCGATIGLAGDRPQALNGEASGTGNDTDPPKPR